MASEIVVSQPQSSLMSVIDKILTNNPNANIETVQQMLALQERWEDKQAEKAFNVAFAEFKAESITLIKNVTVKDGPLKGKKHVDKFGVVNVITPLLSKHGLSHSWKLTKDLPDWIEVTCTLKHVQGHSTTASMGSGPDTGPGRNAIQARSSSNSYLERITLLAVTGTAASDEDSDGAGELSQVVQNLVDDILAAKDMADLQEKFTTAYKTAQNARDKRAMAEYTIAKDRRKAQLTPHIAALNADLKKEEK